MSFILPYRTAVFTSVQPSSNTSRSGRLGGWAIDWQNILNSTLIGLDDTWTSLVRLIPFRDWAIITQPASHLRTPFPASLYACRPSYNTCLALLQE